MDFCIAGLLSKTETTTSKQSLQLGLTSLMLALIKYSSSEFIQLGR